MQRTNCSSPLTLWAAVFILLLGGCASRSQLAKIAAEKEQLKALVESEKRLNQELAGKLQTMNERVAEAERELALAAEGRPPASKVARNSSLVQASSPSSGKPFEQWASAHPLLKFDRSIRAAQANVNVTFQEDRLTFAGRRELDKIADLLNGQAGDRCRVHLFGVEGKTAGGDAKARANAAADYLKGVRQIPAERIVVATRPARSIMDDEGRAVSNSDFQLEIELQEVSGRDESIAKDGWTSPGRR